MYINIIYILIEIVISSISFVIPSTSQNQLIMMHVIIFLLYLIPSFIISFFISAKLSYLMIINKSEKKIRFKKIIKVLKNWKKENNKLLKKYVKIVLVSMVSLVMFILFLFIALVIRDNPKPWIINFIISFFGIAWSNIELSNRILLQLYKIQKDKLDTTFNKR